MKRRGLELLGGVIALAILCAVYYGWHHGGREFLARASQLDFRIEEINSGAGTMRVQQLRRSYSVRCATRCEEFEVGEAYSGHVEGTNLQLRVRGQLIALPILKVEVHFDNTPKLLG